MLVDTSDLPNRKMIVHIARCGTFAEEDTRLLLLVLQSPLRWLVLLRNALGFNRRHVLAEHFY